MAQGYPIQFAMMLENAGLKVGTLEAEKLFRELKAKAEGAGNDIGRTWDRVSRTLGAVGLSVGITELGRSIVQVRGQFQQLEIAFGTMLKSGEKAKALMSDLSEFAATTPFGLQSSASAAKQLLAYGSSVETLIDEMRMLGDVAAGTSQPIGDLVYLYGTLRTQGRAYMMDIRQFAGRGIPIYDELAKVLGVAKDEVNALVSAGKVGFAEVEQAFKNMTSSGGMYGGLMEAQSKSVTGRMEQLKDAIDIMFNEIGKSSEGAIYSAISGASTLVENYEQVGKILIGLVATYGAYRAALIFTATATKSWTAAELIHYNVLVIVEKAQKLLNKTMLANPYVLLATLAVGLVATMWALRDSTTAAEKAQKEHNDRLAEAKTKYDELISVVRDETKAISDRQAALEELRKIYPSLFKDMDIEAVKLANLASLTKQATRADREREMTIASRRMREIDAEITAQNKNAGTDRTVLGRVVSRSKIKELQEEREAQRLIVDGYYKQLKVENELSKKADAEAKKAADNALRNKSFWDTQKKSAEDALAAMEATAKGTAEWNKQMALLNEANTNLETWNFGGNAKATAKMADQAERSAQERAELERKYEDEVAQARVDAMSDGLAKTLAQNDLNFQREKRQIEEQYKELSTVERQVLVDAAEKRRNQADSTAYTDAMGFDFDAEVAAMNEYLIEYGDYQQKRFAITDKYNKLIEKAGTFGEAKALEKERDKALADLDISLAEQSDLWSRLFGDVRDMSAKTLKNVIADTKKLLSYLKASKEQRVGMDRPIGFTDEQLDALAGDAEEIKSVYDELIEKQEAFEDRTNYPFSNIIKGFGNLKKAIQGVDAEGAKLTEVQADAAKARGLDQLSSGAVELTGFLSGAVEKLKELAEVTGDTRLGEFADQTGAIMQNIGAAAQGAASGGWIGAIIGGVTDMISQTVQGAVQVKAYLAQAKQDALDFANSMRMIELDRLVGDNETVFGKKTFTEVIGQAEKAKEAIRLYYDAVGKEMDEFDGKQKKNKSTGAAIFGFGVSGTFGEMLGFGKKQTNEYKAYLDAVQKGYNDLEGMLIKTKDYSGWQEFWGKSDEYKSLKDLAPDLWKDGVFDTEAAKAFLETNSQLSDEQRAQIENVVELKDAYDEAITAIEDQIGDSFGFLGEAITDSLIEAITSGGDAWEIFAKKGVEAFENIGEQLAYELYFADEFAKLQDRLTKAVTDGGSPEDVARRQAKMIEDFYAYVKSTLPNAEEFIKQWQDQFGGWQSDMTEVGRTSASQGFAQASQDSVNDVLGIVTNIESHTYGIHEMMRDNQARQQANTDAVLGHLASISGYTSALPAMKEDIHSMRGSMQDMADEIGRFNRG